VLLTNKNNLRSGRSHVAVARALSHKGARVFLTGRTLAKLRAVADEISAVGGAVEAAQSTRSQKAKTAACHTEASQSGAPI
jgi:NADP-dependent 3-hydroxy acid dehydrogenase YdfG